jgi:2,5-diketo-D-gluconate reductase B
MNAPLLETPLMKMPSLGLGTWPMKGAECQDAVESALGIGYRHIDTAEMYGNEEAVGAALNAGAVPRNEVFLTTKIWNDKTEGTAFRAAFEASLDRLRQPYVDLLLVHWPSPEMDLPSILTAMARIREKGLARAVGVSNFPPSLLQRAIDLAIAPLACLQVEHHAMLDQTKLLAITQPRGMVLSSYTPLAKGEITADPVIQGIARRLGATGSQVALAWLLAKPLVAAIPKAQSAARQKENLAATDVTLAPEDIAAIDALPKARRMVNPAMAPAWED